MSSLSFATPGNEQESQQQQQDSTCSVADLWQSLDRELRLNIGTSVRCGICLTTITDPVRTPCVHAFCKDCIHASLMSGNQKCPECNTAITKRGLQPFEYLEDLSNAYKATLREFAFIPTQYNPQFVTMTQKVDACDDEEEDEATPQQMLDRLDVATAWQQQGLPNVPNLPAIQKSENDQVVQSNWDACKDFLVEVNKLPTTQDMQEQTREQEQADEEWNERRMEDENDENEDENETEVQDEEFYTASEGDQYSEGVSKPVSFPANKTNDIASASTLLEDITPRHTNKTFVEETGTDTNKERSLSPAPSSSPPFVDTELSPIQVQASQPTEPVTENASLTNQQRVTDVTGMMEDSFGALHLMPNESNLIKDNEQNTTADVQVQQQQQQQQDEDSDKTQTPMSASSESKASSSSKKFDLDPSLVYKWNSFEQEEEFGVGKSPRYRTKLGKILSNRKIQQLELESNQSSVEEETDSKPAAKQLFQEDDEVHEKDVDETGDADDEMDDNPADEEEEEKPSASAKKPEDTMAIDEEDEEDEYGFSTKQTTSFVQQARVPVLRMSNEENGWSIGDIVNVQSRTWPGVNKPGGVARITKIHNGGSCYDVSYVLGGKEANIDSGFLSHNPDLSPSIETSNETHNMLLDSQRQRARRQRRRRRCEQEQNELPMALLQSLEHDGYDITGNASLQARVVKKQKTAKAVLQDTTNESSKKTNPKKAQVKMTVATKDTTVITPIENANKKSKKRVSFGHTAPGLSLEEAILSADVSYSKRLEVAIKNKMVNIVTSNLAQDDAMMLKEVAATIKTQQDGTYLPH